MAIIVTEQSMRITKFQVYTSEFKSPIDFYTWATLSDEDILGMETFIEQVRAKDKFAGVYECVIKYCKNNEIPLVNLSK